ncbi:helix-turn-helix transcriptional regulator [Zobellella aerophila]|uniref:HTH luxR-type domain-containing protein n=1 Tax=Zobellella aerophila TaxID=870480 RepID=A0ABP6VSB0_9GAMM
MADNILLTLIDAIYAAAADPALWPSVASKIQRAIGGHSVNLVLEDLADARINCVYSNGVSAAEVERYQNDIMDKDELVGLLSIMPEGKAFTSQDFFDVKTLHSLYCYENFYEDLGYTHFNAGLFYRNHERRCWISVARSEADALYTADDRLLMQALLPHLKRAFLINVQLLEAQLTSTVALDSLEHIAAATALLTRQGLVVLHNHRAEPYLHQAGLFTKHPSLRLPDAAASRRLHKLIDALGQDKTRIQNGVVPFAEKGVRKTALCFPWCSTREQFDWLGNTACCIVFILSPTASIPPAALLQQVFGVSNAEVKVLQQLMGGLPVIDIAKTLFISEATVRFHIHNLLRKTQCQNQTELLSKVFHTVAIMVE